MAVATPRFVDDYVYNAFLRLRAKYVARDIRMKHVKLVREGNIDMLFPGQFSEDWPKSITANFIDSAARDIAEAIATMPTLVCGTGRDDAKARAYAAKKAKAGAAYWRESKLKKQITTAADRYITYGFQPIVVEVDYDCKMPKLRFENPEFTYPEFDRWGNCVRYIKLWEERASTLAALFPEFAREILTDKYGNDYDGSHRLIRYMDKDRTVVWVETMQNRVLLDEANPIGRCMVAVAVRPGLDEQLRGQFDDVIWVQIARNRLALLKMEAAEDAVEAPIAVPADMQELAIGPFAVMRTQDPQGVHKVSLDIPQSVFAEDQTLAEELRVGSRYTGARQGNIQASTITGRGIQALSAGFDTQIQSAQTQLGEALREATSIAFELDDKLFGDLERKLAGVENGTPYEIKWKPSRDLAGDYSCEVSYGFYAGQSLPQAIVTLLQLRGDKDISRTTLMKNIPYEIDVEEELRNIDVEDARETLTNAVSATAGAIPQLVASGGDASQVLLSIAKFIELRGKGQMPEEAIQTAFQPPQQAPDEQEPGAPGAAAGGDQGGGDNGLGTQGPQAPLAPGETQYRPDMMQLLASVRSNGQPQLAATLRRSRVV